MSANLFQKCKAIVLFICLSLCLQAQDLHFTNYKYAPLYLNPANTGGFAGTIRLSGIYRDQFRSFITEAYQTNSLSVDSPFMKGLGDYHWIGGGLNLYSDKAGAISLTNSGIQGSLAYHISGDKNYTNIFTIGLQYGMVQRKVDASKARFGDSQTMASMDLNLIQNLNVNYGDFNVGIGYTSNFSKTSSFHVGAAVMHLFQPNFRLNGGTARNEINRRINLDARLSTALTDNFTLIPTAYVSLYKNNRNIALQLNSSLALNKKKKKKSRSRTQETAPKTPIVLNMGVGLRAGDAIQFLFGTYYKGWDIGLAYDLTISEASAYNNGFGGIELGITRVINIEKKPERTPSIFCPRL